MAEATEMPFDLSGFLTGRETLGIVYFGECWADYTKHGNGELCEYG